MAEYIEREAATTAACNVLWQRNNPSTSVMAEALNSIPAADVAPVRHAKWGVEVGMNFFKERNCPVCKKRIESNFWNFCPNCGALMDGGAD